VQRILGLQTGWDRLKAGLEWCVGFGLIIGVAIMMPTTTLGHGFDRRIPVKAQVTSLQSKDLRTRYGQKGQGEAEAMEVKLIRAA